MQQCEPHWCALFEDRSEWECEPSHRGRFCSCHLMTWAQLCCGFLLCEDWLQVMNLQWVFFPHSEGCDSQTHTHTDTVHFNMCLGRVCMICLILMWKKYISFKDIHTYIFLRCESPAIPRKNVFTCTSPRWFRQTDRECCNVIVQKLPFTFMLWQFPSTEFNYFFWQDPIKLKHLIFLSAYYFICPIQEVRVVRAEGINATKINLM